MSAYQNEYQDPRWQKRRLEILELSGWTCQGCSAKEKQLQVHHINYKSGSHVWEYSLEDFKVYCDLCHERITEAIRLMRIYVTLFNPNDAVGLASKLLLSAVEVRDRAIDLGFKKFQDANKIANAPTEPPPTP